MKELSNLIGNNPIDSTFKDFMKQSAKIRNRLEESAYLFDRYLSCMLETANSVWESNAALYGLDIASELRGICRNIITGKEEYSDHPFYLRAKAYIDRHPLSFQEDDTKEEIYNAVLCHDFLNYETDAFVKEQSERLAAAVDSPSVKKLYSQICDLLGSEEDMVELEQLFYGCFVFITPKAEFMQGITLNLLLSLTYRDFETSKQVFQIILDHKASL